VLRRHDDTDSTPPTETATSDFVSEGATKNEREFTEVKIRRRGRRTWCLKSPDQRTGVTKKKGAQVLPQDGEGV